ncbi:MULTISPECIES: hypothetical protein [unclassified Novosphingobium]|nr:MULTISPECIES: hypothetical protein [unclassified Novosphingobium]NMN89723.1 hypothetical protein [Novosphingobium sp. SG916]
MADVADNPERQLLDAGGVQLPFIHMTSKGAALPPVRYEFDAESSL